MATARKGKLFGGPVSVDLDTGSASIDLPGGGRVSVGPGGADLSVPNHGSVHFGPDGGAVDIEGVGRVEVGKDGYVQLPDGTIWNSRFSFPDVGLTPTPGGPLPIPYPDVGTSPFKLTIPVPNFVVEKFDIPITIPRLVAYPVELPLPVPHVRPTPVEFAWPFPAPPKPPQLPQLPQFELPELLPSLGPPARYTNEIKSAISRVIGAWIPTAEVLGGVIEGSLGLIPPGTLRGTLDVRQALRNALHDASVPLIPYASLGDKLMEAWTDWFAGYSTVVQFPAFAAWPGPSTARMPAVAQTLSVGASVKMESMSAVALYAAVANLVDPSAADSDFEHAMRQMTTWFAARFHAFTLGATLTQVMGEGPVPSYAPPDVPAGPVVHGKIVPSRGVLVGANPFLVP